MPESKPLGEVNLETLFDEIITKTERREAFSEIKEKNIRFSAIGDMRALRQEFLAAETELDLWFALVKLSNARRDTHLAVIPVDGGLKPPERRPCVSAPIRVLPEILDIRNPTFFIASVEGGVTSPQVGDVILGVNGRSMKEHIEEFVPFIRHSTLPGLYWEIARHLPRRLHSFPLNLYSERLYLTLERSSGERYDVSLPYGDDCRSFSQILRLADPYPGFVRVMERVNFNVLVDNSRKLVLLEWLDFERDDLIHDIPAMMEYAEEEGLLDYDIVIDVTWTGGGSGGAYAIQRLVDRPFRSTFGNVRLSDLGQELVNRYSNRTPDSNAPEIFGLNLSRSWLYDWARTDGEKAIDRGNEFTAPVPFKLAHLPKDSDGILRPAPVHFRGDIVIVNARTQGGSHLDQFVAMFVDNDLATFLGVPTGGYSNTWEGLEVLHFPGTSQPVIRFMWSIGHTIRPNGAVLEGNPAQPDIYLPVSRQNYREYHQMLVETAIDSLDS